jgi:transcriptional regulator with XRE-family HTH domain
VERKKTGKWLAETWGKDEATVSRWCANVSQPSLETLFAIAKVLKVDVRELLISTK